MAAGVVQLNADVSGAVAEAVWTRLAAVGLFWPEHQLKQGSVLSQPAAAGGLSSALVDFHRSNIVATSGIVARMKRGVQTVRP
jgi:hypothetical protein